MLLYSLLCREGAPRHHRALRLSVFGFSKLIVNSHAEVGRPRTLDNGNRQAAERVRMTDAPLGVTRCISPLQLLVVLSAELRLAT